MFNQKKMKNIIYYLLLLFCIFLCSCKSTVTSIIINNQNIYRSLKVLENKETNQTIVFFPMVHVGKSTYYENCRKIIDSLRSEGFTFYYENIAMDAKLDSAQRSLYNKKARSILGYNPLSVRNNESLPKFYKKKNIILQDYNLMGITKSDVNLDLYKNQIIDSIEKKYNPIILKNTIVNRITININLHLLMNLEILIL